MSFRKAIRQKLSKFTSILCTQQHPQPKREKHKHKNQIVKKTRNTFVFENTIIKLSRKNIGQQEFMQSQILTLQLQEYLAIRTQKCMTAVMKGDFTLSLYKKIFKPILLRDKPFMSQEENMYADVFLAKGFSLGINQHVDLVMIQLYDGTHSQNDVTEVGEILHKYHRKVKNLIILCGKKVQLTEYSQLFKLYSHHYQFDIERVMQTDNIVCNIIYASASLKFLRIQPDSLVDFYLERLVYFKKEYKNSGDLLLKLVEAGLLIPMNQILAEIEQMRNKIDDTFKAFIFELYRKEDAAKPIISQYFDVNDSCPETPQLCDFTPGFKAYSQHLECQNTK